MDMNVRNKNIIMVVLVFFLVLGSLSVLFYVNIFKDDSKEVEALVKLVGNNYIIVEDSDGNEYSIETNDSYEVGDRVDFVIKNIEDVLPIVGEVIRIERVSQNVSFSITDSSANEEKVDDDSGRVNQETDVAIDSFSKNTDMASDLEVIDYIGDLEGRLINYNTNDLDIGKSLKEGFVLVVDFIFYDGTIKGRTFDSLSNSAKIKVLQLAFSIDKKIDEYFPGYKEEVSSTSTRVYTNLKLNLTKLYLDITTSVCENEYELCESARDGFSDLKESFSLTWDFIASSASEGIDKLKEWYEIWRTV